MKGHFKVSEPCILSRQGQYTNKYIYYCTRGRSDFISHIQCISKQGPPLTQSTFSYVLINSYTTALLKPLLTFPPTTKAFYYMIDFQKFRYLPTCVLLPTPCIEVL